MDNLTVRVDNTKISEKSLDQVSSDAIIDIPKFVDTFNKSLDMINKILNNSATFDINIKTNFKVTSWPELLGDFVDDAVEKIQQDRPDVKIEEIEKGSIVTSDFNSYRVRVFYRINNDEKKIVSNPYPRIG